MIQANVIEAAFRSGVSKLLFLCSSCIYPKIAAQPMRGDALLTGMLEAIIRVRKNARKLWKENRPEACARNEILRAMQRLGRDIWKRWSGYHRRSLGETKMRCVILMGGRVMARDFDRRVAELQVRAAILNRFTRLCTQETVRVVC